MCVKDHVLQNTKKPTKPTQNKKKKKEKTNIVLVWLLTFTLIGYELRSVAGRYVFVLVGSRTLFIGCNFPRHVFR